MTSDIRTMLILDGMFGALLIVVGIAVARDPQRVVKGFRKMFLSYAAPSTSAPATFAARMNGVVITAVGLWFLGSAVAKAFGLL